MKRNLLTLIPCLALIAGTVFLNSCSDDDPEPPKASFTYVANGREVTFTNTSTNATTYAWNFGDGTTSTDQNPVHTYEVYGKYTVTLNVTGDGGTAAAPTDEITLAKSSAVVLDGAFTEWASIPVAIAAEDGGTITKVKVDYDATKIYFYVEGTANLRGFFDVYIDSDNDSTTGFYSPWYPVGFGAEFLSEGEFATGEDKADLFAFTGGENRTGWLWEVAKEAGTGTFASSVITDVGSGKAIEFSILRSSLTDLADAGFSFAVVDVDGGASWEKLGSLPADNKVGDHLEAKLHFFDLTK